MVFFLTQNNVHVHIKKKTLFQPVQVVPMGGSGGVGGPENWLNSHSEIDNRP